jgi:hypothetical protein
MRYLISLGGLIAGYRRAATAVWVSTVALLILFG